MSHHYHNYIPEHWRPYLRMKLGACFFSCSAAHAKIQGEGKRMIVVRQLDLELVLNIRYGVVA